MNDGLPTFAKCKYNIERYIIINYYTHLNCLTVIVLLWHLAIIHLLLFIYLLSANHDHELFLDYGYN